MIHLSGVNYESIADAPGVCCVIFISGCKHHCEGCHSQKTHDFSYGVAATDDVIEQINREIRKRPYLSGLVLSGGDPMYSATEVCDLLEKLVIPHNRIWCFSGFYYEQLVGNPSQKKLLEHIDVLVDGPFIQKKRDITLKYRGSNNQRLVDVKKSLQLKKTILYES